MKKSYVSSADQCLNQADFIQKQGSDSQLKEIKKHENIYTRILDKRVDWD